MQTDNNSLVKSAFSAIVKINMAFLQATAFGFLSWWMWPDNRFQYGWMFLAIVCGLIAFTSLRAAFLSMASLYRRDKALAAFIQKGAEPKSSTLASEDALRNAGMR